MAALARVVHIPPRRWSPVSACRLIGYPLPPDPDRHRGLWGIEGRARTPRRAWDRLDLAAAHRAFRARVRLLQGDDDATELRAVIAAWAWLTSRVRMRGERVERQVIGIPSGLMGL